MDAFDFVPDLEVVVTAKDQVAVGVCALSLARHDRMEFPPWRPGAHIDLVLSEGVVRQYSLRGDPGDRSVLNIAVLREVEGRGGSAFVHDAVNTGSELGLRAIRNHFELVHAERYLFIAGGIGITPLLPMMQEVETLGLEWQLLYGGRTRRSMAFVSEMLDRFGDRITVRPQDEYGLLDLDALAVSAGTKVYCCGPEPLLKAAEARSRHWPAGALHVERFAATPDANARARYAFEVQLARSRLTLEVPPDRSVLDVVAAAGVDVLSSCQEGICGSCETRVLDGLVDHRDSILSDDERSANDVMMICVSRSLGPRLTLDL